MDDQTGEVSPSRSGQQMLLAETAQPEPAAPGNRVGKVGFYLSLLPWLGFLLMLVLQPG